MYRRAGRFVALARAELEADRHVVAITHHTTILTLRALLEQRPITDLVQEARTAKTPSAGIRRYEIVAGGFTAAGTLAAPTA